MLSRGLLACALATLAAGGGTAGDGSYPPTEYCDGNGGLTQLERDNSDPSCRGNCFGPSYTDGCSAAQVCAAMRAAPSEYEVQKNGIRALGHLDGDAVRAAGGIPLMTGAMGRFPDNGDLQYLSCYALAYMLVDGNEANQAAIRAASGHEVAIAALTLPECQFVLDHVVPVDLCAGVSCGSHGRCDSESGTCRCDRFYFGAVCEERDICREVACGDHGRCVPSSSSDQPGRCECEEGWTGAECETHDLCNSVACGAHGSCDAATGQCACAEHWFGEQCESYDVCYGVACGGHGRCTNGVCICDTQWAGTQCQTFDPCLTSICGMHGQCIVTGDGVTTACDCEDGWYGDDCETFDPCRDLDCGAHGVCQVSRGPWVGLQAMCLCNDSAWSGDLCDVFDNCYGIECGEHGSCNDDTGECVCDDPVYFGEQCQEMDPCRGHACGSHGHCTLDNRNQTTCQCALGYSGDRCETYDECQSVSCGSHGRCHRGTCHCHNDYTGTRCQYAPVDPCANVICGENGWCSTGLCECDAGFSGAQCEHSSLSAMLGLASELGGIGPHAAIGGAGLAAAAVVVGLRRRMLAPESAAELSAPLATTV
jgi:hypothetical protein